MKKNIQKNILIFFLIFAFVFGRSQNETKNWFFGANGGLSFSTSAVSTISNSALSASLGCSSISDASGNLLFYTDGVTIWNQTHTVMANGSSLLGNNSAQSSIIIKKPASSNLYYVFTVQGAGGSAGLNYSIVDMSLASGQGSVTSKNISLNSGALDEKIGATKHCNGNDVWIVTCVSGILQSRLLTSLGVATTVVTSTLAPYGGGSLSPGCLKLSPNGKKLGICSNSPFSSLGFACSLVLLDFDNTSGLASNEFILYSASNNPFPWVYGCEFSPDGTKFYATSAGAAISQWDLCASNIPSSTNATNIPEESENPYSDGILIKGALQLASNGKIYVARFGKDSLGVINYPNLSGSSAMYNSNGQSIGTATCGYGLPNFMSSYFENRSPQINFNSNSTQGCMAVNFIAPLACAYSGYTITGTQWDFGDLSTGAANTSSLSNPTHTYSSAGTYTTRLILNYDCGKCDTIFKSIPVTSPIISISHPPYSCGSASATVSVSGGTGSYSYTWSPSSQTTSVGNNLSTGNYTVFMKDNGGGCASSATTNIQSVFLNASFSSTNPSCYSSLNGIASTTVSGGSGNYSYTWSPGVQTSSLVNSLAAGIYTLNISDAVNQCSLTQTLQIIQPNALTNTIIALTSSVCLGGKVVLFAGPGGGTPIYTYLWGNSHSAASDTIIESNAGAYIYSLTIQDANFCSSTSTALVNFVPNPILSAPSFSICKYSSGTLIASGANSYTWLPGSIYLNSFTISPASSTVYTVSGEALGCISTLTTSILVYPNPSVNVNNNGPLCIGQTVNLNSNITGNVAIYQWSGPSSFISSLQNLSFPSNSINNSGVYSLTVLSANSCSASATTTLTLIAPPSLSVTGNFTICSKNSTTLTVVGANTYTWNNSFLTSSLNVSPLVSTTYTIQGCNISTGCTATETVMVTVLKCTSIDQFSTTDETPTIFPNPTKGFLNLKTIANGHVRIYSELGLLMTEQSLEPGNTILDLDGYSNGVYIVSMIEDDKTKVFRLIILK